VADDVVEDDATAAHRLDCVLVLPVRLQAAVDEPAEDLKVVRAGVDLHTVAARPEAGAVSWDLKSLDRAGAPRPESYGVLRGVGELDPDEDEVDVPTAAPRVSRDHDRADEVG
jgi:hypothetical protein